MSGWSGFFLAVAALIIMCNSDDGQPSLRQALIGALTGMPAYVDPVTPPSKPEVEG